jgi:hypothetical protein
VQFDGPPEQLAEIEERWVARIETTGFGGC